MKSLECLPVWIAMLLLTGLQVFAQNVTGTPEPDLHIKKEISVGDILTLLTITISLIGALLGFLISSAKDRRLKRKEYADKIRHAAGVVIAKLERWRELSLRYFDDIQPTLTDTDVRLIKRKDAVDARDFLWRNLVALHAQSTLRIVEEEIEIAYSDLYGYDPRIYALYVNAVQQLKKIDDGVYGRVLDDTQADVAEISKDLKNIESAQLGNALRFTCGKLATELEEKLIRVIDSFRSEMIKLIEAGDKEIVGRQVKVSSPDKMRASMSREEVKNEM